MATEERLLRLENAYITLSDLAARAEERAAKVDERLDTLTELALNFDSRMDGVTETQARTEANLAALTTIVGEIGIKVDRLAGTVERYISEGRNGQS